MQNETPVLVLKPKYVLSFFAARTIFLFMFGAAFISIISMAVTSALPGIGEEYFIEVIPAANAVWLLLYLVYLLSFVPRRYAMSSYRFYPDRVEYEAITVFSMQGRSVYYARVIETGCIKGMLQFKRGMGDLVLKVAATGGNSGPQNTVMLDNLVMTDIEDIDKNLQKVRAMIPRKS